VLWRCFNNKPRQKRSRWSNCIDAQQELEENGCRFIGSRKIVVKHPEEIRTKTGLRLALPALLIFALAAVIGVSPLGHRAVIGAAHADGRGCSLRSVVGTYGVSGGGTVGVGTANPVQDTEVGLLTADGNGNVSGSVTFSANGTLLAATYTGTYTVNSDCTATASINDSLGEHLHETGVLLKGGDEIRFIGTDPGAEVSRDAIRLDD
jgi:hypothetical protein